MTDEESAEKAVDLVANAINVADLGRARDVAAVPHLLERIAKLARYYYELAQTDDVGISKEDAAVVALVFHDLAGQVSPTCERKPTTQTIYRDSLAWALDKMKQTGELTDPEIGQMQLSFGLQDVKAEIPSRAYGRYTGRINQGALTPEGERKGYGHGPL